MVKVTVSLSVVVILSTLILAVDPVGSEDDSPFAALIRFS